MGSLQAPRVTVRVAQEAGDMLRVEVSDTGPGIAAGDQAFIFGKFAQGRRGFGAQGLGSGLGCAQIAYLALLSLLRLAWAC